MPLTKSRQARDYVIDELKWICTRLVEQDTNYEVRYGLVLAAMSLAHELDYPTSVMFDPKEGLKWPVFAIELPTGQVSWHMPSIMEWDGHDTEEKLRRLKQYVG